MRWIPFVCAAAILYLSLAARAEDKPSLVRELKDNVRVRLVAARVSETRGRYLIAKVETTEMEPKVLQIYFPAHSFTTHEQTLRAVIQSCCGGLEKPDKDGWFPATAEAIFSVPKEGAKPGAYSRLEKCFLVSLHLRKGK